MKPESQVMTALPRNLFSLLQKEKSAQLDLPGRDAGGRLSSPLWHAILLIRKR